MTEIFGFREQGRIYIDELARPHVINRKAGTIRKWESEGRLPKHLLPKRGTSNRRYWSHSQVYGARGIIKWMERNDMRPGNLVTDPSKEAEHIDHLRKPKFLTGLHIRSARQWSANGKTREYILRKLFPRTKYAHVESLERALEKVAAAEGWELPAPKPKKKAKPTAEDKDLDRMVKQAEAITVKARK